MDVFSLPEPFKEHYKKALKGNYKKLSANRMHCIFCYHNIDTLARDYHTREYHFHIWFAICFKWRWVDPVKYKEALAYKEALEKRIETIKRSTIKANIKERQIKAIEDKIYGN